MPVLSKITLLVAVASFSVVFGAPNPQTSGVETAASDSAAPPFPFEEVVLTEADIQAYPELAFADVAYSDAPVVDTVPAKVKRTDWSIPRTCKFAPFDNRWPSNTIWSIINLLTDKSLIKTTPLAAPCYQGPLYDQAKCAQIRANWSDSDLHDQHPSSIMSPLFQGASCLPIDDPTKTCTIGGYPYYVIKATSVFDVQVAVNAARNLNLRLVVKNTGHDFSGKSSGGNSLSIWTHHLKGINFMPNLNAFGYKGPAFKVGSGIQGFEIYEAAAKQGLMVVGGEGMTVGYAGGYLQGGGHSPLSSILGMGADHILEFEVVTADGRFITANKDRNSDLFWALRGGGGSTFGVVTSVVVKAYKTVPVTTVSWAYSQSATVSEASFWDAFKTYMSLFPKMADAGVYSYFQMFPGTFNMQSLFCPNLSKTQVQALMAPLTKKLADLKIPFSPVFTEYTSFYPAWKAAFPKEAIGQANVQTASRLFPRANWVDPAKFEATYKAVKDVVSQGLILIAFNIAPTTTAGRVGVDETAVNPAWRNTLFHAITGVGWAENATQAEIQAARSELTNVHMKKWRDVSPGAGAYLGESDINEPNFQQAFYGTKYDRLYEIKQKYDPHGVFYAATAVGSEDWKLDSRGRLCPV